MSNEILRDAVEAALNKDAVDFKEIVQNILAAKVADRLAPVREAMEQSVFGEGPEDEEVEDDVEDDSEDGDDDWAGFEFDDEEVEEDEDGEQVDEISDKLANRYVKAAVKDIDRTNKAYETSFHDRGSKGRLALMKRADKRERGIDLANGKMGRGYMTKAKVNTTEDVEQVDEISADLKDRYMKKASLSLDKLNKERRKLTDKDSKIANAKKRNKRETGMSRAFDEDVEQVDELSNKTLQSYREKSHKDSKPRKWGRKTAFAKQTGIGAKVKATD